MRSNAAKQTGLLITYSNEGMRKQWQEREEKIGKKEIKQAVRMESQETVTTMDPAESCWSVVPVCVGGVGPLIVWSHGLL